jgi:hypothetical protein
VREKESTKREAETEREIETERDREYLCAYACMRERESKRKSMPV